MNNANIESLTIEQLIELKKQIEIKIIEKQKQQKQRLIEEFTERAEKLGLSIEDLVSAQNNKRKPSAKKLPPKFQHPENPELTWTGRGRKPLWIEEAFKHGLSLEQLKI